MAKSLHSKVKKRLRTSRRKQLMNLEGNQALKQMNARISSSNYDFVKEYARADNAYLHPNNVDAVFPQMKVYKGCDMRSSSINEGGTTVRFNSRKMDSLTARKNKFPTIVKTTEDLDREE